MGILQSAIRKLAGTPVGRVAGQVVGKVGNVAQQVTSKVIPGKQIVPGGLSAQAQILGRKLNPVKTASAVEPSRPKRQLPRQPAPAPKPVSAPIPRQTPVPGPQAPAYQPTSEPASQQQYNYEVPSYEGPSAEDQARQAAEERMSRYGELVAPVEKDIESYLAGRPDIKNLFEQEMASQGIPSKQKSLETFEGEERKLTEQLKTLPEEEITRRKETGMLTAAAERRIRAMEERPIREQLIGVSGAKEAERVGLQRAFDLVDKMLDLVREQEKRGLEPLQTRLEAGRGEFGQEVEALASRLSGFTEDRKAQLEEYKAKVDAGLKLTLAEKKEASELNQMAIDHQNKLEQIMAKEQAEGPTEFETKTELGGSLQSDIVGGATLDQVMAEYLAQGMDPDVILSAYNSGSPHGEAQESAVELTRKYGVSGKRFGEGANPFE